MVRAAHRRLAMLGVLLMAGACESVSKSETPSTTLPGPAATRPTRAPAATPKEIQPIELSGHATHLAYHDGSLYWLSSAKPDGARELVTHNIETGNETVLARGSLRDFKAAQTTVAIIDGANILLVSPSGGEPRVVAANQHDAHQLRIDATHVYWSIADTRHVRIGNNHPGSIRRVARAGEDVEVLSEDTGMGNLAMDGEQLYWSHNGIQAIPKAGGDARSILSDSAKKLGRFSPMSLRAGFSNLYAGFEGGAYRIPVETGDLQKIYEAQIVLDVLPIDEGHAIVSRNTSFANQEVAEAGAIVLVEEGSASILAECERPLYIALGPGRVYFIDSPMDLEKPATIRSVALPSPL